MRRFLKLLPVFLLAGTMATAWLPIESSELALLMREMYEDAASVRKKVEAGKVKLGKLPIAHRNITKAKPTDASDSGPAFEAFASSYVNQLEQLYNPADPMPKRERWNLVVSQCVNCHKVHCPGPLKRIERLKLP